MEIETLLKDFYFWVGLILFIASLIGVIWILKSLQKDSRPSFTSPIPEQISNPEKTVRLNAAPSEPARVPDAALLALTQQMGKIEEALTRIEKIVDKPEPPAPADSNTGQNGGENAQISDLSAKVDKIYQVLSALSGPGKE